MLDVIVNDFAGGRRSASDHERNRRGKEAAETESAHVDVGVNSPDSEDFYKRGRKSSQVERRDDSDSEQSLYDRHGNRKGYAGKRSLRFRSRSSEEGDSASRRMSGIQGNV